VFPSTAATFFLNQGDRAILGLHVSLEVLGVYLIGFFLGSVPTLLSGALQQKVVFPLYRMRPPTENAANRAAIFRVRRLIALGLVSFTVLLAFAGPALVEFLYDPRYAAAGPMITVYALSAIPLICLRSTGQALMGMGDTRRMFFITGTNATLQTGLMVLGVPVFGIPAVLLAPGIALLASYPLQLTFARRYRVFDPVQDIGLVLAGLTFVAFACTVHWDAVLALMPGSILDPGPVPDSSNL
jgi:O-antigen/teichoic acid export membrane protein